MPITHPGGSTQTEPDLQRHPYTNEAKERVRTGATRRHHILLWGVTVYSYVDIGWCLFDSTGFITPDGSIVFIQCCFDLLVLVYLSCLFSIANLDGWLTVLHLSITLV